MKANRVTPRTAVAPLAERPNPRRKPLSHMTLPTLLKPHAVQAVPHGFRSRSRHWVSEQTNHPRHLLGMAHAHQVNDQIAAAYPQSTLLSAAAPCCLTGPRISPQRRGLP